MPQIFVEAKVASLFGIPLVENHLYLVYRADDGREWVLRGGPASDIDALDGGKFDFEINVPIADSSDDRAGQSPADRRSTLLTFVGQSADQTWNLMCKYAQEIDAAGVQYSALDINSNTFVAALIECAGRDPAGSLPNGLGSLDVIGYDN